MQNYSYPISRGYKVGFSRSLGYAMGHVVAHTLLQQGKKAMQLRLEDKHKRYRENVIDAEFEDVGARWAHKHAQFGGDYSRSVNKPAPRVTVINKGTPLWKIILFVVLGAIGWSIIGNGWLHKEPSNAVGYYYTENGEKYCMLKSKTPNEWDIFPTVCPRS